MTRIVWDDKYKVGVKIIDDQHKHFVGLINAVYKCLELKNTDKLPDLIKDVMTYAEFHFKTEEDYFAKFGYEGAEEHKTAHGLIRAKMKEFSKRKDDPMAIGFDLIYFLERWLLLHFRGTDKKYVECFNKHGLK